MVEINPNNKRTLAILIALLILMTGFGYVAGLMSSKVIALREAQTECYAWLETQCPCMFPSQPIPNFTLNIYTEDSNVQKKG